MKDKEQKRAVNIALTEKEIAAVRQITKVDTAATGVVAIVRTAIEDAKQNGHSLPR